MRMPQLKYYPKHEELNKGFVFTNLSDILIQGDYVKNYITTNESKRNNRLYDGLKLTSYFLKKQKERTKLSGEFPKIFLEEATKTKLKDKIEPKPSKIL